MLDPKGRKQILKLAKKLNRELGIGIVFITHHMREVSMFDRVIVLGDGKIVLDDSPENLFSNIENLKSFGLDLPEVSKFALKLKQNGIDLGKNILNVDDCVTALYDYLDSKNVDNKC